MYQPPPCDIMGDVAARMTDCVERCNTGDGTDECEWCTSDDGDSS